MAAECATLTASNLGNELGFAECNFDKCPLSSVGKVSSIGPCSEL